MKQNIKVQTFVSNDEKQFVSLENGAKIYERNEDREGVGVKIKVDESKTYQVLEGFGASFTDTAVYNFMQMSEERRQEAMDMLFDRENGLGLSLIRNPIAGCDFSLNYYSYDDMPDGEKDWELREFDFSPAKEQVELTKAAFTMNPDMKLFLAPWSAPLWMKTKQDWIAKSETELRPDCYDVYARYLVKAIQGYEKEDISVYSVSVQNEPYGKVPWPGMIWNWEQLAKFTNENLRPVLEKEGLHTKIHNLDHNYDLHKEAEALMEATQDSADGIGWHWYCGQPEEIIPVCNRFPDKDVYVTEASSTRPKNIKWIYGITSKIARALRSGAQGYILWNLCLNQDGGPTYNNVNTHCSGVIEYDARTDEVIPERDYYALCHYSKFMKPGAVRVESTDTGADSDYKLVNVVAKNPDGRMTAVISNLNQEENATCQLLLEDFVIEVEVAACSTVTLDWNASDCE